MMISINEGTIATFPSRLEGRYRLQFTLRGGHSYTKAGSFADKESAERAACELALSHPQWRDMEANDNWVAR